MLANLEGAGRELPLQGVFGMNEVLGHDAIERFGVKVPFVHKVFVDESAGDVCCAFAFFDDRRELVRHESERRDQAV